MWGLCWSCARQLLTFNGNNGMFGNTVVTMEFLLHGGVKITHAVSGLVLELYLTPLHYLRACFELVFAACYIFTVYWCVVDVYKSHVLRSVAFFRRSSPVFVINLQLNEIVHVAWLLSPIGYSQCPSTCLLSQQIQTFVLFCICVVLFCDSIIVPL